MSDRITIDRRFSGPPGMAHGGYVGGLLARELRSTGWAEVRLRRPTPLEVPLDLERADDRPVRLLHEGTIVAECRETSIELDVPTLVTPEEAARASYIPELVRASFFEIAEPDRCFGCGPKSDGLRLHPDKVLGGRSIACSARLPLDLMTEGVAPVELLWAAVDCPSMWACWVLADDDEQASLIGQGMVTGSLAVRVHRLPSVDEDLFVQAWRLGREDRKIYGASVLVSGSNDIVATARQTAIVLS